MLVFVPVMTFFAGNSGVFVEVFSMLMVVIFMIIVMLFAVMVMLFAVIFVIL